MVTMRFINSMHKLFSFEHGLWTFEVFRGFPGFGTTRIEAYLNACKMNGILIRN